MAKSYNQKMKILFLLQLFQNSKEEDVYPMQKIVEMLDEVGIRAERKSIYDDLEVLRQYGLDIHFRKERPSGYYLGTRKEMVPVQGTITVTERKKKEKKEEGYFLTKDGGEEKQLKLLCNEAGKAQIQKIFGQELICKEKDAGNYQLTVNAVTGPSFYGWLTAYGNDIRIQKPKKEAALYRDYMKNLAKEYKGI